MSRYRTWRERDILKTLKRFKLEPTVRGNNIFVPCPAHRDSPDDGGSLAITRNGKLVKCFSGACGVSWSTFEDFVVFLGGEHSDLRLATKDPSGMLSVMDQVELLSTLTNEVESEPELPPGVEPWNEGDWRGIRNEVLQKVESYYWYDDDRKVERILWPIRMGGDLRGWTSRNLELKPKNGDKHKHSWGFDHKSFMLFLDLAVESFDYIILVEGPVDGLALWNADLPGVSIFGSNSWSDAKEAEIIASGVNKVILGFDTDPAGRAAREHVELKLGDKLELYHVEIPKVNGQQKVDFGNVVDHIPGYFKWLKKTIQSAI
jgi:5S rRNA maturation endonuclease (ribonuclease M5)